MTITLALFGAARLKDSIYTVGGFLNTYFTSATAIVQKYDIKANTWTTRASLPIPIGWPESVGYQDSLIYSLGGMNLGGSNACNLVYLYNCNTNSWRSATNLPIARCGGVCALAGDTIVYACGTSAGFNGASDHVVYRGVISQSNRSTITWTTGLSHPGAATYRINGASWGCKGIIIAGGSPLGWGTSIECYVYSPGANTWTVQPNMPYLTSNPAVGSVLYSSTANIYKLVVASGFSTPAPYSIPYTQIFTDTLPCNPPPPNTPWCEGFSSNIFPPTGWTITGGSASYWLRNGAISGFGLGTGSAYYNMWSAPPGENEDFKTFTFSPTSDPSDSLEFDYAYSPYPCPNPPFSPDSLIILVSTNSGISWISLARYGPVQLQTYCGSIPGPNDWAIKRINLPLGSNKIDFLGKSGFGNDLYLDSICVKHPVGINPISNRIPDAYSLSQNYPNPFNPTTTIKFEIPASPIPSKGGVSVKLVVYDILGREVASLIPPLWGGQEGLQPGTYEVEWDGSIYPSGVYFYKLSTESFSNTKKMVLIK